MLNVYVILDILDKHVILLLIHARTKIVIVIIGVLQMNVLKIKLIWDHNVVKVVLNIKHVLI